MLPQHVKAEVFQHLQIVYHRLPGRRSVQSVRPVSLVKSAKHKRELPVEKGPPDTVDLTLGDGAKARVAGDFVIAHAHCDVIQRWRVGAPQVDLAYLKLEWFVRDAVVEGQITVILMHGDLDGGAIAGGTVYGDVD